MATTNKCIFNEINSFGGNRGLFSYFEKSNYLNNLKNEEKLIIQAIEELETIINRLEEGDVPLDETINLYEKGSELKDFCEKKLQSAEVKIQKINQKTKTKEITLEDYKK